MGRQDSPLELGRESVLHFPVRLKIVAAPGQLEQLRDAAGTEWFEGIDVAPLELNQALSESMLQDAEILVVHVDLGVPDSMQRIEWIRTRRPDLPLVVALADADIGLVRTLVRQGVADVVTLPLNPEELLQASLAIGEVRRDTPRPKAALAPLVAVVRSLGGSGATTLLTHLARQIAENGKPNARVCVIDLDVQFGRVAEVLGLNPPRNVSDLLEAGSRIDAALLRSVAVQHDSGVSVIAAPREIVPLEAIDGEEIRRIVEVARREYDFVLLDTPSNWSNWSLALLLGADSILMVVEQSLASLRQARRRLDLFEHVGIKPGATTIVVNRLEKRLFGSISLSDVSETLGREVLCGLRADPQNLPVAQDQGLLVGQVRPKSAYAADIAGLAEQLEARLAQGRAA